MTDNAHVTRVLILISEEYIGKRGCAGRNCFHEGGNICITSSGIDGHRSKVLLRGACVLAWWAVRFVHHPLAAPAVIHILSFPSNTIYPQKNDTSSARVKYAMQ